MFNGSNVEEFCISSDSTICVLTEPFEFSEAVGQKKIGDNYLRIGESEITMLFAEESDNEVNPGNYLRIVEPEMLFAKESEKVTPGGIFVNLTKFWWRTRLRF